MYIYHNVKLIRVIDGDTAELEINLGNRTTWRDKFRLNGIDTPERGQPGYAEAAAHLTNLVSNGIARCETFKQEKFGRYLVALYVNTSGGELLVNRLMVIDGHAKDYDGGAR